MAGGVPVEVSKLLADQTNDEILGRLLAAEPWLFVQRGEDFSVWRSEVVQGMAVASDSVFVMGSAAVGFSLSPLKMGRPFREDTDPGGPSDVDLAVVDEQLFMEAWEASVTGERNRVHRLRREQRQGFYWGHADQKKVPGGTAVSRQVLRLAANASRRSPVKGHPVTVRLYRRQQDLWHYQLHGLVALRQELLKRSA